MINQELKIENLKKEINKNQERIDYLEEKNRRLLFILGVYPQPWIKNTPKFLDKLEYKWGKNEK